MNPSICLCCLSLLLLLNLVGAKPVSDLQTLKQLLEEELSNAPFYSSDEEVEAEAKDANTDKSLFGAPEEQPWDSSDPSNSALQAAKESALTRLFKDLMRTSKRSWSRYKKAGLRSCFGVRLERIGSFSGLGC
ncbi:natriuretic peptide A-like [Xyrichtys novacula]|uniref:Natriuretic peptide A-like n=1 Tax=Xyrichtys novacula TaxID=13765 RepID=A0AAV1F2P6_XYRNO|nr:natriuretic peptide A-like [Xyrichtys novacula]